MIQDWLLAIINSYNERDYYKYGHIPPAKLSAAFDHYQLDPEETPLALIDTTVFGSTKHGMVIGTKGVYWKNDWNTETEKSFLSWQELARNQHGITQTMFDIELAPGCKFGMAGCSMSKRSLISLLEKIVDLYRRTTAENVTGCFQNAESSPTTFAANSDPISKQRTSSLFADYADAATKIMAVCLIANGKRDDSKMELAMELIDNDDFVVDKDAFIVQVRASIDRLAADRMKGNTIFRLRVNTIFAKAASLRDELHKQRCSIIVEGLREASQEAENADSRFIFDTLQKILAT